jgi:hypothetical protein
MYKRIHLCMFVVSILQLQILLFLSFLVTNAEHNDNVISCVRMESMEHDDDK